MCARAGARGHSAVLSSAPRAPPNADPASRAAPRARADDGLSPCLTCATNAGRVFIHSPHERDQFTNAEIQHLNINRKITAMAAGVLDPKSDKEALLVGAQTTLLAYDIRNNADLFYKDVPDGVNAMKVGTVNAYEHPLAVVGGNCSIQGFDHEGSEQFWTVTGDNVACLEFCDVDSDGRMEMLVGSEDFEIRIFRSDEVVSEVTETAAVVGLAALRGTRYGYALANGTIGVYDRDQRVWRVKSKHTVSAIAGFDLDGDGEPELISGWTQGRLEVRSDRTGDVVFKDSLGQPVAAIVKADYRKDGNEQVIVCGAGGEVRAYVAAEGELQGNLMDGDADLEQLHALTEKKARRAAAASPSAARGAAAAAAAGGGEARLRARALLLGRSHAHAARSLIAPTPAPVRCHPRTRAGGAPVRAEEPAGQHQGRRVGPGRGGPHPDQHARVHAPRGQP